MKLTATMMLSVDGVHQAGRPQENRLHHPSEEAVGSSGVPKSRESTRVRFRSLREPTSCGSIPGYSATIHEPISFSM
jgi:hypothetical protein